MREAIARRLRNQLGPMLRATSGAVVSEVLGHERMKSALIYPKETFIYDFISQRHEAYRSDQDPLEREDRFGVDPVLSERARQQIAAYRDVRAGRRQFVLRPEQRTAAEGSPSAPQGP